MTFVVFHVVLSRLLDLETWAEAANQLLAHGGPRPRARRLARVRAARPRLGPCREAQRRCFPLFYMAFALIRGALDSAATLSVRQRDERSAT